jgi:RecA-family ATPase
LFKGSFVPKKETMLALEPLTKSIQKTKLRTMNLFDLLNKKELEVPKLWDPFISSTNLHGLIGPSDTGKSTFLKQLALAVVSKDNSFLGYPLNVRFGRVIYVSLEDDEQDVKEFFKIHLNGEASPLLKNLKLIFDISDVENSIHNELITKQTDLVIIDPWSALVKGSTNNLTDVRDSISRLRDISRIYGTPFMLIHHTVKSAEKFQPDKNRVNGSQAIEAALRLIQELRNDSTNPNIKYLTHLKGNRLPNSMKEESIQLNFNEKELKFEYKGNVKRKDLLAQLGKGKYDDNRESYIHEGRALRSQGYSFTAIKKKFEEKFGADNVPSETWFKENL